MRNTSLNFNSPPHTVRSRPTDLTDFIQFARQQTSRHFTSSCDSRRSRVPPLPPSAHVEIRTFVARDPDEERTRANVRAEERRLLASCGELRRRTEAATQLKRASNAGNERIFQLAAPAEMRRLCLSINMRRDKATRSFIRSSAAASGSLGLRV